MAFSTQDVYKQYRVGGNLEKVLQGTRNIIRNGKKELKGKTPFCFLPVSCGWIKPANEHQDRRRETITCKRSWVLTQVRFKTAQVYDYENDPHNLIPTIE